MLLIGATMIIFLPLVKKEDSVINEQASVDYLPQCAYISAPDNCPGKVFTVVITKVLRDKLQRAKF